MGTKSKPFRAFVEGETISDGRKVTADMINDIVATFNAETYSPRVNVEHITGYSPDPPFNGYGTVTGVSAQDDDITIAGKTEKRRALYAVVDGNEQLVALAERDQKPFPSVEITPNYTGTGKFGLVGLGFTDNPASIATQRLQFARVSGNLAFTAAERTALAFETPTPDASAGAFAAMKAFFERFSTSNPPPAAPTPPVTPPAADTPNTPANDNFAQLAEGLTLISASITALGTKVDTDMGTMRTDFGALKTRLENTEQPQSFSRPPAAGGDGKILTDC